MAFSIRIVPQGKTVRAEKGDLLAGLVQEAGVNLGTYCNKRGLCGKCFVEILDGPLPPPTDREKFLAREKGLGKNFRLACLYTISGTLSIRVPIESLIEEAFILKSGIETSVSLDPAVRKYSLNIQKPGIAAPSSLLETIKDSFKDRDLQVPLAELRALARRLESGEQDFTAVVYSRDEILSFEPEDTQDKCYGLAVDIGTTTLVVELLDLNTGRSLDVLAGLNSQVRYGADVISRITHSIGGQKNLDELRSSVLKTLNGMIRKTLKKNRIDPGHVYEVVVAGNTTMNHLLLGMPLKTLAVAPYHAVFSRLDPLPSSVVGLSISQKGRVHIVPNIKSFVGGDITAGLIASGIEQKKGDHLFIDLGTNGEIVLKTGRKILATSTAAGPAFEGMNISCGMPALPGAVYKVQDNGRLRIATIGGRPAAGICGTGLIDLISIFLKRGVISPQGVIKDRTKKIRITGNIFLTQKDVRELQLAVAAVKTGVRMILAEGGMEYKNLDGIFIAGAFGNYLNISNSIRLGLLPPLDEKKIVFIGNSSLAGARALLLSNEAREKASRLVEKVRYLSLAMNPSFQENFIKALEFKFSE